MAAARPFCSMYSVRINNKFDYFDDDNYIEKNHDNDDEVPVMCCYQGDQKRWQGM